ncbi:Elongator complex protein 2 [Naviculisporaceae sp. PSN 640]
MSEIAASVKTRYLSAGANRYAAAADWGEDGLVAFGADTNVCLWDPSNSKGISQILSGHGAHVRAVKFLPKSSSHESTAAYLVSGGDDKDLRLWALNRESHTVSQHQLFKDAHTAPINCIATLGSAIGSRRCLFVTGAADASVKVWSQDRETGQVSLIQSIKTTRGYLPLALALGQLNGQEDTDEEDGFILAVGGTTNSIQIFTSSASKSAPDSELQFTLQATLPGHENWIRSLDFTREKPDQKDSDILLASASQDKYIRIWRIHKGTALSALNAAGMDISVNALMPGNKIHKIKAGSQGENSQFCIMFEALLLGHEDWIYTARWAHSPSADNKSSSNLQLLSASADNSLSIWQSDAESGIWITVARLGEISREKGATTATGSIGGFWTGLWSPSGTTIATLGRTGSWRRWDYDVSEDMWKQNIAVSGHTRSVTGISWSHDGSYLLSTSSDQTTRLHAQWLDPKQPNTAYKTWHEMSRPQIHGYDLNCIDSLGPSSFVSGADEKLMRVFTKPKAVAKMLSTLTGTSPGSGGEDDDTSALPDAANMPVLGLSNKAIDVMIDDDADLSAQPGVDTGFSNSDREALDPASMVRKSALEIDHPPFEESLSRHTLWPEVEKLYGHGYEISCLAASHDGKLIASACKATSLNHAVIRLFETTGWTEIRPPLMAHSLTVTRLRFSLPNEDEKDGDKYLLSVGRDRQWAVFEKSGGDESAYQLLQANTKGHSRMILDGAWAPTCLIGQQESKTKSSIFATAGRDKQVKIWVEKRQQKDDGSETSSFELALSVAEDNAVTALDFLNRVVVVASTDEKEMQQLYLAVGTEGGKLTILQIGVDGLDGAVSVTKTIKVQPELWLPKAVTQLAWRPAVRKTGDEEIGEELAIAGEDGSLRVYEIRL